MSDLTDRLRDTHGTWSRLGACDEAADEIERLAVENSDLKDANQWWRERYNNLVSTMSCAVDGECVAATTTEDKYPLSEGAKVLLSRISSLSSHLIAATEPEGEI